MSQPQGEQLTLHGKTEKVRKRGPKKQSAYSWTADEKQFAEALIATWNDAFKAHRRRAHKLRGNRREAIRLYRWLYSDDNDADPKMTEEDVHKAIRAYSQTPWNLKEGPESFKPFGEWIKACPDNVDRQLARIGERCGAGVPTKPKSRAAEFAEGLLETVGLGQLAQRATRAGVPLIEHLRFWAKRRFPPPPETCGRDVHSQERAWRSEALPVLAGFLDLPESERASLVIRARKGASAYLDRTPGKSLEDRNIVTAIAIGLAHHAKIEALQEAGTS